MALTVSDIDRSKEFYETTLGLQVFDSTETYCSFLTGSEMLTALILTTHEATTAERFSELRPGLDHVSLAASDVTTLEAWQRRLTEHGVDSDLRRSEWGHHLNFRDPDNIAIELVVLQPDEDVQQMLDSASQPER